MAMGLCNGVATFQRLMEYVLAGLNWQTCLIYIDDIIVFADSFESHVQRLHEVLNKLAENGLKVSPKKCHLFQDQVTFLGHVVSRDGVATDPEKVEAIKSWPSPKNIKEVRAFLGTSSYYRKYQKNFASIAKPLHRLTEKNVKFDWTETCEDAFQQLKTLLSTAPVLAYPDMTKPFILDTDASGFGVGAVLSQKSGEKEDVIAYFSKSLSKAERQYCVTRRELLAVVSAVKHFHHYLYGSEFLVRTDHGALNWLLRFKNPEGQMARWLEVLSTYNFEVQHRPGRLHNNADGLSRRPCYPCNYCNRQDQKEFMNTDLDGTVRMTRKTDSDVESDVTSWIGNLTNEEISEAQKQDETLKILHKMKSESDAKPTWQTVAIQNSKFKKYWSQWYCIYLENNVLYRKWTDTLTNETIKQLLVPNIWQDEVLELLHNSQTAGHLGVHKTTTRAQIRVYWAGYKEDILNWIRKCAMCSSRKQPPRKAKSKMKVYNVGAPMERVALDILGPLPLSEKGNKYALIVSDYFTRWAEGYPMPNMETKTIVDNFVLNFICRFGVPKQIHTDQGRQFESALFKELCNKLK